MLAARPGSAVGSWFLATSNSGFTCRAYQRRLDGLKKEEFRKKALTASEPHAKETLKELRADRQLVVTYLKATQQELGDPTLNTLPAVHRSVGTQLSATLGHQAQT